MGHDRRLAWLLGVDIATTAVGVVVLLAAHFFVVASGYFLLLAAMVAGAGLIMASGYRPLRAGRTDRVVAALAVANYLIALAATAIAPFAMPILLLATMLPAVLAVPYVSRRQLHGYVGASFVDRARRRGARFAAGRHRIPRGPALVARVRRRDLLHPVHVVDGLDHRLDQRDRARRERGGAARVAGSRRGNRRARAAPNRARPPRRRPAGPRDGEGPARQPASGSHATRSGAQLEVRRGPRSAPSRQRRAARPGPRRPPDGADGRVASARPCDTPSPPSPEMRRSTSARPGASIPKWSEPCTSVSRRPCRTPSSTVATGSTSDSCWTATNPSCASPSATTVPDSIRRQPPSAPGSTTWSIDSARSVGNSPSAPRSGAARQSPERCRPARFLLPCTPPNSSQRYLATRAGHLAPRRPLAQCGPQH